PEVWSESRNCESFPKGDQLSDQKRQDSPLPTCILIQDSYSSLCVLVLCGLSLSKHGVLEEMFKRTYGFILSIEDLSPNIGAFC
ncbi:unnamed protein product, partial [Brassica rapa subsp. trilocularis]